MGPRDIEANGHRLHYNGAAECYGCLDCEFVLTDQEMPMAWGRKWDDVVPECRRPEALMLEMVEQKE